MTLPSVRLATDELPKGPWIYGRQVEQPAAGAIENGALVAVYDRSDRFVGHGFYNAESDIRVRILSTGKKSDLDRPRDFFLVPLND